MVTIKSVNISSNGIPSLGVQQPILIGRTGENNFTPIGFNVSEWLSEYPEATITVVYCRPDKYIYPVLVGETNSLVIWTPKATDLAIVGEGIIEVRLLLDDIVGKSAKIRTIVNESIGDIGETPELPVQDWIDTVSGYAINAAQSAENSENSSQNSFESKNEAFGYAQSAHNSSGTAKEARDIAIASADKAESKADIALVASDDAQGSATRAENSESRAEDILIEVEGIAEDVSRDKSDVGADKTIILQIKNDTLAYKNSAEEAMDDAIEAKDEAGASAIWAQQFAEESEMSRNKAEIYKEDAKGYRDEAESFKNQADTFAQSASGYVQSVSDIAEQVEGYKDLAFEYKGNAEQSKIDAETAKGQSEQAKEDAETAKGLAEQAKEDAELAKSQAEDLLSSVYTKSESDKKFANALIGETDVDTALKIEDISPIPEFQNINLYGKTKNIDGTLVNIENPAVYVAGKNLFDMFGLSNKIETSATIEHINNKLKITSKTNGSWKVAFMPLNFDVLKGKAITVSFNSVKIAPSTNQPNVRLSFISSTGTIMGTLATGRAYPTGVTTFTATIPNELPSGADYLAIGYNSVGGQSPSGQAGDYVELEDIQIEIGDNTSFESYKTISSVNLQDVALRAVNGTASNHTYKDKNGNYWISDSIEKTQDKVYFIQRVGNRIFSGSDSWSPYTATESTVARSVLIDDALGGSYKFYTFSNSFTPFGGAMADAEGYGNAESSNRLYLKVLKSKIGYQEGWTSSQISSAVNTYLSSNPFILNYLLATPVITDITDTANGQAILDLKGVYPTTTFLSDCESYLQYNKDINKAFAELQSAIIAMGGFNGV